MTYEACDLCRWVSPTAAEGRLAEFRILGSVEAVHAGEVLALGGPRHRRLLAVLLLHAGDVVPVRTIMRALWGEAPPRTAMSSLHVRVSQLRAALRVASPELHAGKGGYVLKVGPDDLDAWRFERLAIAGAAALAAGDPAGARADLGSALALWRGPALAEFAEEPFALIEVVRLAEMRLQAVENRIAADLDLGHHAQLAAELETLVAEHPLRERFWGQLMLALYRAGRQSEALQAYQSARRLAADHLGLEPGSELQHLQMAMLRHDPALDPPLANTSRRDNLPAPLTSFVGRRRELPAIRLLLRTHRLVTLTGAGGMGKSRLAIETARAYRPDLPGGAWLVELGSVSQPELVASAVAAVLDVREHGRRPLLDVLCDHIGGTQMLLVLDNCEHLITEVVRVAEHLLESCPNLRVLATSRERLGITGEVVRPVAGLGVPARGAVGVDAAGRADAVRLLVDRAAAVVPGFQLTDVTVAAMAEICRRLDGMPLALELAAAGVNVWGVEQFAARLDKPYEVLNRGSRAALPRHQSLRAVVDWSYGLLDPPERRLFNRLAVFACTFTLPAAEAVCGDGTAPPVADVLARLVDKSLITVEQDDTGQSRYRMALTLRAYAAERLNESGTASAVRYRHAEHVVETAEQARRERRGHPDRTSSSAPRRRTSGITRE